MENEGEQARLIERAFPLKQASLDSVHEKNVRHGHISTLHIWPARRPLAACRAALIATLLPDPGDAEERRRLIEKHRRAGRSEDRKEEDQRQAGRGRARGDRRRHPALGARIRVPTCNSSARRFARPTAAARRACSIRSPAAARSRWKRCGWDAKSPRSTSIRSPGSSSNARSNIRRSSPGRSARCPISSCATASSWSRSSRRRASRARRFGRNWSGSALGEANERSVASRLARPHAGGSAERVRT